MEGEFYKKVSYSGEDIHPAISIDNDGWSATDGFEIRKFRGRRPHPPRLLRVDDESEFNEMNFQLRVSSLNCAQPGLDWGIGCFGNPTKLVETGKGELTGLYASDFHEVRTAKELFEGNYVWTDDEWIHFQRLNQRDGEPKTELDLIDFHEEQQVSETELDEEPVQRFTSGAEEFLESLDNLESAPEGGSETRAIPASIDNEEHNPRSAFQGCSRFRDWIDEADFVEANAKMPKGTRYYNTPHKD
ncbi:hypothetical protein F4819DRAFT_481957 [Hypoxylon fuscum]|nr:hypothetical protein F4819DRAFT_481957 [Hypoxylon fuscum]